MRNKNKQSLFHLGEINHFKYFGFLFIIIMGIFLWPKIAYLSSITPEKIIELTNKQRMENDLNSLTLNEALAKAAYEKAQTILSSGKFQHNIGEKKFSDWIREADYQYSYIGENLAIDFVTSEGTMNAWLNSTTHKKNIFNSYYEEIGVAVVEGKFDGQNTTLVVQIFGTPPLNISQPITNGSELQNHLITKNYLPYYLSSSAQILPQEKLLTHAGGNELIYNVSFSELKNNYFEANYQNNDTGEVMNNFFAQHNLLNTIKYFNITFSFFLLSFVLYIYFLSFLFVKNDLMKLRK